jgi:thiol-disulfide isomerase/thioredoxin
MKTYVYAGIALVAGIIGFVIYRFGIEPQIQNSVDAANPQFEQTARAPAPVVESDATPELLPEFTLTDREGDARSIHSWPGKALIINFWATWCGPCRREIPLLKRIQAEYEPDNFQVVGIAVDFRDDVLQYAEEIGINYPLLIGEQDGLEAIAKFGISAAGFPFTVFTDTQSRIVLTHLGEIDEAEAKILLGAVKQVNAGELSPAAARTVVAKQLAQLDHAHETARL